MKISIVSTLYFSASYIEDFYSMASASVAKITSDYEIIFVNDGSPDESLNVALKIKEKDNKIKIIDLSRNFGHHMAMMIGLRNATGDYIFLIDIDLEEKPDLLEKYYSTLINNPDADVVYGVLQKRKGGPIEKIAGWIFYRLINFLSGEDMPKNIALSRLMTRRYVSSLIQFQEREIYLGGLWHITGYTQIPVTINKTSKGSTTYTLSRKLSLFANAIVSFSIKPLILVFISGICISVLSLIVFGYVIIRWVFFSIEISGWASTIISIWLLGGLIILFIGIIGIYLSKIFTEVKQRPYGIIKRIY